MVLPEKFCLRQFWSQERGSLSETGLIIGLIAVVAIVAVTQLGSKVESVFTDAKSEMAAHLGGTWTVTCRVPSAADNYIFTSPIVGKMGDVVVLNGSIGPDASVLTVAIGAATGNTVSDGPDGGLTNCTGWAVE